MLIYSIFYPEKLNFFDKDKLLRYFNFNTVHMVKTQNYTNINEFIQTEVPPKMEEQVKHFLTILKPDRSFKYILSILWFNKNQMNDNPSKNYQSPN